MAKPSRINHLPAGWVRVSYGGGRCVGLFMRNLPFAAGNAESKKWLARLGAADKDKPFVVVSMPDAYHDYDSKTGGYGVTMAVPAQVKVSAFTTWTAAENAYEALAKGDAGKSSIKKGLAGLFRIGRED